MIYTYECRNCGKGHDLVRSVDERNSSAPCPACQGETFQVISSRVHFIGASRYDHQWNPAFGKVIKSREHSREEMKHRGWEEVGNETPDSMEKTFSAQREKDAAYSLEGLV